MFFVLIVAAAGVGAREKAAEMPSQAFDREAAMAARATQHGRLVAAAVPGARHSPFLVDFAAGELAEIDQARGEVPERVGLTGALGADIAFTDVNPAALSGAALFREHGALEASANGGFVYTAVIASPEATALRVHFRNFDLPAGVELFLYTEDGQVFGPYAGRGPQGDGEFWSHTVMGDEAFLQLGLADAADLQAAKFHIADVGHLRPRFLSGPCSYNADCIKNLACAVEENYPVSSAIADAKLAVAHMQWISGPYLYMCTGGLLADSDTSTTTPWFLSANHCISRGRDAKSLELFFQLTSAVCETSCDDVFDTRANHPQNLRVLGATIRATNRTGDYTLFELNQPAPTSSAYLGWNTNSIANSNNAPLYRISHPSGAPQSYSEQVVDTSKTTCSSWPRGSWVYSRDTYGATEGGSSGSPVVNGAGQVVGQLSGACGFNVNDSCDSGANATVDGAFAAYFPEVAAFLDNGGACVPSPEVCDNGTDDDCDGWVDLDDPDCATGGGGGLPSGSPCSSGAECASGVCKGKAGGQKICK